jgi:hypothetical protein
MLQGIAKQNLDVAFGEKNCLRFAHKCVLLRGGTASLAAAVAVEGDAYGLRRLFGNLFVFIFELKVVWEIVVGGQSHV